MFSRFLSQFVVFWLVGWLQVLNFQSSNAANLTTGLAASVTDENYVPDELVQIFQEEKAPR